MKYNIFIYSNLTSLVNDFCKKVQLSDWEVGANYTIGTNRLDTVIKKSKEHKCYLLDMIITSDRNISVKEFAKLSKYDDLEI